MSNTKPIINPYYGKWDTPKQLNRFQRAVFNGRTRKVKDLITSGENVYVTTDLDESPLFISIVRDHKTIVNLILDIYEEDLLFVRQFFKEKHNIVWSERPIFVAFGKNNTSLVNELGASMEVLPGQGLDETKAIVVMLKSSQEKKILWLLPNSHEDNVKIAKIIECIWNDGVIDLQHIGHWGRTVFDAAAIRNQPEVYCRLNTLSNVDAEKSIRHFLQMCRNYEDKLDFFKNIWRKSGVQIDIADIVATNVDVLVLPAYWDLFDVFVFFLGSLADKIAGRENREVEMKNILNTHKAKNGSTIMETIIWADHKDFVQRCLTYFKPNLMLIGSNNEIVLQSLIAQQPSPFMTEFVVEYFDRVLASGMEATIIHQLIERNWLDAVKTLYDRYDSIRKVLFRNKKQGVQCLLNAIDGCRYDLAKYLVDAHREELTDPDDVTQLILYCSFVERGKAVLETLLTLPAAEILRTTGSDHYYKSPIYVALKYRHLENFQLLMNNVKDPLGLRDLKEDNGENLLYVAIWFKENPVDESPFVYVEEEHASLEIVDSSDNEDESFGKMARNEQILTSAGPYKDPIKPDSYFEKQSIEMARIFNYFLEELSLDYQCINNIGETLLHVAVKYDNYDAVKQLLGLGFDVNVKDACGNYPIHGVRSSIVLNMLRDYKCDVDVTNACGETPLLSYVKSISEDDENQKLREQFLIELLAAGANVNHADVNGLTVLHLVKNSRVAQILLQHGAPINMKNNDGETPILYVFHEQVGVQSLYKVFLCDESLDVFAVSKKNVSVLSVLVALDNLTMSEVLSAFEKRSKTSDLDNLFIQHCNSASHDGCPVLIEACSEYTNSYCLDKLLTVNQLNPNINPDYEPLEAENKGIVRRLLDRGANVNGSGHGKRKTPLMHAIGGPSLTGYKSSFETFAMLLAAGADLNVIDLNGDSALDYACRLEHLKDARRTIAALILANVNYNQPSCENKLIKVAPFQSLFLA